MLTKGSKVYYRNRTDHIGIITNVQSENNATLFLVEWDDAELMKNGKKLTIGYYENDLTEVI